MSTDWIFRRRCFTIEDIPPGWNHRYSCQVLLIKLHCSVQQFFLCSMNLTAVQLLWKTTSAVAGHRQPWLKKTSPSRKELARAFRSTFSENKKVVAISSPSVSMILHHHLRLRKSRKVSASRGTPLYHDNASAHSANTKLKVLKGTPA